MANLRFLTEEQYTEALNLYHLARTALAAKPYGEQSKYHRMVWASKAFHRENPEISATAAYKDLSANLQIY